MDLIVGDQGRSPSRAADSQTLKKTPRREVAKNKVLMRGNLLLERETDNEEEVYITAIQGGARISRKELSSARRD